MAMNPNLPHKAKGISTYLQTFLLIGVALGGSAIAYKTVYQYSGEAPTQSLAVSNPSIRQGTNFAVERITVTNQGTAALSSFSVLTQGISAALTYCASVWNPQTQTTIINNCPTMTANPTSVQFSASIPAGGSYVVVLTILGANAFTVGRSYELTLTSSGGSQAAVGVVATPG